MGIKLKETYKYEVIPEEDLLDRDTIEKKDNELRKSKKLLGRYIFENIGGQTAYYEIVRVSSQSVRIKSATNVIVPRWGRETIIPLSYAEKNIGVRDYISKALERKFVI